MYLEEPYRRGTLSDKSSGSNLPNLIQINTCGSTFHAVNEAHTKFSQGYSATGVGAVDCARHGFKRPNGVVDLQKGER
jgi:hypothetical protein